ncbi:MAG: sulfite exporter TauE/SafE family protein [bacterium]
MNPLIGYALLGLGSGFLSGCFGVGGGGLIVPVLILFFAVPYHVAVGTSLALILPISLAGGLTNFKLGNVNWAIFTACVITGVLGAVLGALLIQYVPALYAKRAFAAFLVYTAWKLWTK